MILKNALVFLENRFAAADVAVENGKIAAVGADLGPGEDCSGLRLLPGLVDIHTHGCGGFDFDHAGEEQLRAMCRCYLRHGVTAVLATLMTNPRPLMLEAAARCGGAARAGDLPIRGIYLEGPFSARRKREPTTPASFPLSTRPFSPPWTKPPAAPSGWWRRTPAWRGRRTLFPPCPGPGG